MKRFLLVLAWIATIVAFKGCVAEAPPIVWPDVSRPSDLGMDGPPGDVDAPPSDSSMDDGDTTSPDIGNPDQAAEDTDVMSDSGAVGCIDDLTFFRTQVWEPFVANDCTQCHVYGGEAEGTLMVFSTTNDPAGLAANLDAMEAVALDQSQGSSLLLLKPTGQIPHTGGQRFDTGSLMYAAFVELVARFETPGGCGDPNEGITCATLPLNPGPSPLRRLTSYQFANTLAELLDDLGEAADGFPKTSIQGGFSTYAGPNVVSGAGARLIMETVESVAQAVAADPTAHAPCPSGNDADCASDFIEDFGARAYRRPLLDEELATLLGVFQTCPEEEPYGEKIGRLVEAILQSPQFLYIHAEEGDGVADAPGVVLLSEYAMASRLSYFLWDSMPDEALFARAKAGDLNNAEGIFAEVERMLEDPRAQTMVARFHREWLHLYRVESAVRDPDLYPTFNGVLASAMTREIDLLVNHIIFDGSGLFRNLLDTQETFANPYLAAHYGISIGPVGVNEWVQTTLGSERKGLLNRAAFATAHAYPHASSPIHRGHFVIHDFFCQKLVIPPLPITELPEAPNGSVRDRLEMHRADPLCASCHERMDSLGLAFEHWDAVGLWRDEYANEIAVDATGTIDSPSLSFEDSTSLTDQLKYLELTERCYAQQWMRYAFGRSEQADDQCSIESVETSFQLSGGNVQTLIHAITQSDSFRYRWKSEVGGEDE